MALIPPHFMNAVVAIGDKVAEDDTRWVGTAFYYGRAQSDSALYRTYLVTNRHVLDSLTNPVIRANPAGDAPAASLPLPLAIGNVDMWTRHPDPDVDLAVLGMGTDPLNREGFDVTFVPDGHAATVARMSELGISEGDAMFILGFPMGLVGRSRGTAVVRHASLARFSELRDGHTKDMLVDGYVFPGNSGGPAFTRPESISIAGTSAVAAAYLVGVVAAYVPYADFAVSEQTGRPRVMFEENSGLCSVIPIDFVHELTLAWDAQHFPLEASEEVADEPTEPMEAS